MLQPEVDFGNRADMLGLHAFEVAQDSIRIHCEHLVPNALASD